jgi:ADP-heptose:LPS heptosyltransferase
LIQQSACHLSGDTGTLHLALMTGTPTVSWFRTAEKMEAWIPSGPKHRALLGTGMETDSLKAITIADLMQAVKALAGDH